MGLVRPGKQRIGGVAGAPRVRVSGRSRGRAGILGLLLLVCGHRGVAEAAPVFLDTQSTAPAACFEEVVVDTDGGHRGGEEVAGGGKGRCRG